MTAESNVVAGVEIPCDLRPLSKACLLLLHAELTAAYNRVNDCLLNARYNLEELQQAPLRFPLLELLRGETIEDLEAELASLADEIAEVEDFIEGIEN